MMEARNTEVAKIAKRRKAEMVEIPIERTCGTESQRSRDMLSVEEPLEIRIKQSQSDAPSRSIAVTMRTPGDDFELALGFLFTEGVISSFDEIQELRDVGCNRVEVLIKETVDLNLDLLDRHSFVASSCGVCGKKSIEAIQVRRNYVPKNSFPKLPANVIHLLPAALSAHQKQFDTTGGIHASALFDFSGQLVCVREDIGRHNALDKLIGAAMQQNLLPLENCIVLVSGRASFELVQKAAHAGVAAMAAVGAPSSLAVELAQSSGMTLLGFVRNNRFNDYTFSQREASVHCSRAHDT